MRSDPKVKLKKKKTTTRRTKPEQDNLGAKKLQSMSKSASDKRKAAKKKTAKVSRISTTPAKVVSKPSKGKISYMNPDGLGKNSPTPKKKKSYMSYSDGGRTKKPKKAKGARTIDKAKRKFSQFKNRKTEKAFKRTRNTNLQDKPRSGNSGMYSEGGFIQFD